MRTDQFYVFSRLGKKHFIFDNEKHATEFFEKFIGDAMLMKGAKSIAIKDSIEDAVTLIHAGIFIQHGILRDESNIIDERYLEKPKQYIIEQYEQAIKYFSTPGYGLGLFGESGLGKTTMMRFLNMASQAGYINGKQFENVKVYDIIKTFKTDGFDVMKRFKLDDQSRCNICIDDLGRDNGMRLQYGDKINILADIIESRYDSYIDHGLITHFTTNYSPEELQKIYDTRDQPVIWGRICEMTNFLEVEGTNHRFNLK